jgi:pimeloyl-ACP methyl ester carboxylesterase
VLLVVPAAAWLWLHRPRSLTITAGQFPEEIVYVQSTDDVVNGGVVFTSPKGTDEAVAVIWVHGWGVNFYSPTYTNIGRALAALGLTTISVNTRMHDLGTTAAHRGGKRVRGGGYWGIQSEQDLDLEAWIDLAERLGYTRVVLVGHSAGWAAVAWYRVRSQDPRVAGVVLASGSVQPLRLPDQPKELAEARSLVEAGASDDLVRLPNRNFPSFISAGTLVDQAETPPQLLDFFGVERRDGAVARLGCPLLAFFGTRGDVGGQPDLDIVKATPTRLSISTLRVDTALIDGADHMYTGEEGQVARLIDGWVRRAVLADR